MFSKWQRTDTNSEWMNDLSLMNLRIVVEYDCKTICYVWDNKCVAWQLSEIQYQPSFFRGISKEVNISLNKVFT